jgi:hypothetical protein
VTAPTPVAVTESPGIVALAVPVELDEDPLAEVCAPAGAGGGAGAVVNVARVALVVLPPLLVAVIAHEYAVLPLRPVRFTEPLTFELPEPTSMLDATNGPPVQVADTNVSPPLGFTDALSVALVEPTPESLVDPTVGGDWGGAALVVNVAGVVLLIGPPAELVAVTEHVYCVCGVRPVRFTDPVPSELKMVVEAT